MSSQISIRLATLGEHGHLESIQRRASLMWEETREALLALPDAIQLPEEHLSDGRTLVAEMHGEVVGFAVLLPREDGDAELDGLFVDPSHWRLGIGKRLVINSEDIAASSGAKVLHVIANTRAVEFYVACGFAVVGEVQTTFEVALALRKNLGFLS